MTYAKKFIHMKNIFCCMLLMLACILPATGQNTIKMDPDLKSNSMAFEAKRKAITTFPKYQFGPYAIVTAKAGWTIGKSSSKMRFILEDTNSESKTKSSFVLVGNNDTVKANMVNKVLSSETALGRLSTTNQINSSFMAEIVVLADSSSWQLKLQTEMGPQITGMFHTEGELTNGELKIHIYPIKEWDSGKTDLFKMILGYELVLNDQSVAAVQSPQMTTKRTVWIRESLDEHLKMVLATASAIMMVRSDMIQADLAH
jgi:hypothetical protein